ncbi:hypothetical protein HAX54_017590 [Datura stramonium]|uniref:Uncharacterized protein n=1 Tax=Datura stramonium TaxID=4076 RepID=A0ABS8S0I2_DATST|nr:hypothetical protein [Datura stramonium]
MASSEATKVNQRKRSKKDHLASGVKEEKRGEEGEDDNREDTGGKDVTSVEKEIEFGESQNPETTMTRKRRRRQVSKAKELERLKRLEEQKRRDNIAGKAKEKKMRKGCQKGEEAHEAGL